MGALVSALPTPVVVEPGEVATCELRVRNAGSVVDEFTFEVLGAASGWSTFAPPVLNLLPGSEETARLTLAPPRQCTTTAGPQALVVRVVSREDPDRSAVAEGVVDVAAFVDVGAQLAPRTSRSSRAADHRVTVSNRGNVSVEATVTASDPDQQLTFDATPVALTVEPCGSAAASVRVRARHSLIRGREQTRPFEVTVGSRVAGDSTGSQAPVALEGAFVQAPLLSWWMVLLVLAALAVVVTPLIQDLSTTVVVAAVAAVVLAVLRLAKRSSRRADGPPA
jgi:hypothetical protein